MPKAGVCRPVLLADASLSLLIYARLQRPAAANPPSISGKSNYGIVTRKNDVISQSAQEFIAILHAIADRMGLASAITRRDCGISK